MADLSAMSLDALVSVAGGWQSDGQKVVLTNGVFDILHVGHVAVLEAAAAHGDKLVVAVNADASVKRLGQRRCPPVQPRRGPGQDAGGPSLCGRGRPV